MLLRLIVVGIVFGAIAAIFAYLMGLSIVWALIAYSIAGSVATVVAGFLYAFASSGETLKATHEGPIRG